MVYSALSHLGAEADVEVGQPSGDLPSKGYRWLRLADPPVPGWESLYQLVFGQGGIRQGSISHQAGTQLPIPGGAGGDTDSIAGVRQPPAMKVLRTLDSGSAPKN